MKYTPMALKNNSLILLLALAGCIWLAGCSKSTPAPPSIIGSWALVYAQQLTTSNGVITSDDSVAFPPGQSVITFQPNGYFVILNHLGMQGGGYTFTGNILVTVDTPGMSKTVFKVMTLTEHTLYFLAKDTTALVPLTTGSLIESYSR